MGAELNAGTGKETTSVYSRVLDDHLERRVRRHGRHGLAARAARTSTPSAQVVLEEIAMYEDDPQDKVFDVLGEAVFGDHPLGRAIIGRAEVDRATRRWTRSRAFHARRYRPGNVVVAAAGSVDHDAARRAGRARRSPATSAPATARRRRAGARRAATVRFERKDTEQYHVCLGAPGIARDDERRFALRVLDTILGGTSSSRLFQEVRERRGLAYAVYSFPASTRTPGRSACTWARAPDNLAEALRGVGAELERAARRAGHRRGAAALQGERQGPRRALAGVDRARA